MIKQAILATVECIRSHTDLHMNCSSWNAIHMQKAISVDRWLGHVPVSSRGVELGRDVLFFTTANPCGQKQADSIFPKNHPGLGSPYNLKYLRHRYS